MLWSPFLLVLAVWTCALTSAVEERTLHRLVGGHYKIFREEPQDAEFLIASASGSKNKKSSKGDDEEKKTLSQQVADGKYGLIQKELFTKPVKRPGVISYENNPEVPKDNIKNLGGLSKNDIWLAENHLLVLRGGTYPPHDDKKDNAPSTWPAIDDYKAPSRQVKIPAHPKVPPPFPVQLAENGPLQILGTNSSRTINGTFDETVYALPPPDDYEPPTGPFYPPDYQYTANLTPGQAPQPIPAYPQGEYLPGVPFPPFNLNGTLPPFFASLPPGAAILPPPNQTEIDEDDPSIYYPPPYSFYYPKDNSSLVPPGPLVPGIILPPPPNFFGPLQETTTTSEPTTITTTTTKKPFRTRIQTTTTPLPQIHPTTTSLPPTSGINEKITKRPVKILPVHTPSEINNELKPIVTTPPPKVVTVLPVVQIVKKNRTRTQRPPTVTVLKPVKTTSAPPRIYVYDNEVQRKPFDVYGPPSGVKNVISSTTRVPLKFYYSTTNDIETNSITQPPEKIHIGINNARRPKTTTKSPTNYYYYEEPVDVTTRKPFYDTSYEPLRPTSPETPQQFIYVTGRPYNTQRPRYRFVQQSPKTDTFSLHIARLQKQISQYYTTPRSTYRPLHSPKPIYQFSFEAANYRPPPRPPVEEDPQDKFRPLPKYSVQIQPAIEVIPTQSPRPVYYSTTTQRPAPQKYYTPRPHDYEYEDLEAKEKNPVPPRPVSQYSFEATPNPIYQGFYTKPDENYFDENTKQYFTTFGKKIPSATTPLPLPRKLDSYQQKPISLEGDTDVNYLPPRPAINPQAEFISPSQRMNDPQVAKYSPRPAPVKSEGPEIVKAIEVAEGQEGSFISYQLPGDDGAHFYFLTPQLAQRRDQGAGFYYSNVPRVRRDKER